LAECEKDVTKSEPGKVREQKVKEDAVPSIVLLRPFSRDAQALRSGARRDRLLPAYALASEPPRAPMDQRLVQVDEPMPDLRLRGAAQLLQQTDGRGVHVALLGTNRAESRRGLYGETCTERTEFMGRYFLAMRGCASTPVRLAVAAQLQQCEPDLIDVQGSIGPGPATLLAAARSHPFAVSSGKKH
jgi:hypothetical protein